MARTLQRLLVSSDEAAVSQLTSGSLPADVEDQIPLDLWDNALATDRQRLSARIKHHLRGALLLTQLQQVILDQTVQQAVAEYSRDHSPNVAYTQTPSGANLIGASAGFADRDALFPAEGIQREGEWPCSSASMIQSYLPRSMLIPGTTPGPWPMESTLSPRLPRTMQPNPNCLEQQHLGDDGDMFLGLSLDLYLLPFDETESVQTPAIAMSMPGST
jgi:hypothetical protein